MLHLVTKENRLLTFWSHYYCCDWQVLFHSYGLSEAILFISFLDPQMLYNCLIIHDELKNLK